MSILGAFGLTYPQKKTLSPSPSISLFLLSPLLPLLIKPVPCLSSPRFPRQVTSLLTTMELAIQTTGRHLLSRTTALFSLAAILGYLILVLETALVILILGLCQECSKNSARFAQFLLISLTYVLLSYFVRLHCTNFHVPLPFLSYPYDLQNMKTRHSHLFGAGEDR